MLRHGGNRLKGKVAPLLLRKMASPDPLVRAAAIEVLADLRVAKAASLLPKLLEDKHLPVRRAAAMAAGKLGVRTVTGILLKLARDADAGTRRASIESLRLLKEPGAVAPAVEALIDAETQMAALHCLEELGGPDQAKAVAEVARRNPSAEVLPLALRMITGWSVRKGANRLELERLVAELQGATGALARWQAIGPAPASKARAITDRFAIPSEVENEGQTVFASGAEGRVRLGTEKKVQKEWVWSGYADFSISEPMAAQFLASSGGTLRVWLDGKAVYQRDQARPFVLDSDRFDAGLSKGRHRLFVQVTAAKGAPELHFRFRRKSSAAEHERLIQAALSYPGIVERGRKIFFDVKKSQCVKCHRIREHGERIGPDLSGIGNRFSRIHIIESILEPSRSIAQGYETLLVELKDGRILSGTRVAESAESLTLGDKEGNKHVLPKANIETRRVESASTMPDGLERNLTTDEFIDLVAFLVSQK